MPRHIVLAGILVMAGGCATSRMERLEGLTERQLERAEEAGVRGRDLDVAEANLELARLAWARGDDEDDVRDVLAKARARLGEAQARQLAREQELAQAAARLAEVNAALAPLEQQVKANIERGLLADEAERLVGSSLGLQRQRARTLETERTTAGLRLRLAQLELLAAEAEAQAADTRAQAAGQRFDEAAALFELAREQARTLELELLAGRQAALTERVSEITPK